MTNKLFLIGIVAGLAASLGLAGLFSALSTQSAAQMMGGNNMGMMGNNVMTGTAQVAGPQIPWYWTNKASFGATGVSNVQDVQITGISITESNQVSVNLRYGGNGTAPNVVLIATTNPMGGFSGIGMMNNYGYPGMMMYGYGSGLQDGTQWQQMQSSHNQMMGGMQSGMMSGMPMIGQGMMHGYASPATTADFNSTQWKQWNEQMIQFHNQMILSNGQLNSTQFAQMQEWHNMMMAHAPPSMMALMHGGTWNDTATTAFPASYIQSQLGSAVLDTGWSSNAEVIVTLVGDGSAFDANNISVMVFPLTS